MENKPQEIKGAKVRLSKRRRVLRLAGRLLLFLLFLVVLPILLFQIPAVQNYAAQKLTRFLSNEWQTDVAVEKVHLGLFYEVNLDKLYVEDLQGDTLLYAGELDIDHEGVLDLLFREFTINSIALRDATIKPKRENGLENFQFLVDYFSRKEKQEKGVPNSPFRLNVQHLLLENVYFFRPDDVKEEKMDVTVARLEARFDRFDLLAKKIDLASLDIASPNFYLDQYPREEEGVAEEETPEAQLINQNIELGDTNRLLITVQDFDINDGQFHFRNYRKEPERLTPPGILNFNYLDVFDIQMSFHDFSVTEDLEFHGQVEGISCRDTTGFVLENLAAQNATLTCEGLWLYDMELVTPHTRLGDTLIFTYDNYYAWEKFVDEVDMNLRFSDDAHVALRDIIAFAPKLRDNLFFSENRDEEVKLSGHITGEVNSLNGRNLKIDLAKGVRIEGGFSTFNLAVKDEELLHLKLDRLQTTVRTLRKLIPGFRPPENFNRLGRLDFSGKFDGFFVDFVADGKLRTDIGSASMFMNMKLPGGRDNARYYGDLSLTEFDLGAWSGNEDLGKVSFSAQVKEGRGLTLDRASAKLAGQVEHLEYRNYDYGNVALNGELEKNKFTGALTIDDENANLDFNGILDFKGEVPEFFFKADIRQLSLLPLNISKRDLQFSGHLQTDLKGTRLSDITGGMRVSEFQVVKNQTDTLRVSDAILSSNISPEGKKSFSFKSNLGNLDINGYFDLEKIPNKFTEFVSFHYPGFADRIGLVLKDTFPDLMQFDYRVELFELQNLLSFFEEKLRGFDESTLHGSYHGATQKFTLEVQVPKWSYGNVAFDDVFFQTSLTADEGRLTLGVIKTCLGENNELAPVQLIGTVYGDTLEFLASSLNFFKILDNINVNGVMTLEGEDAWRMSFKPSDLTIMNQQWKIDTDNYIRIGKGTVETKNFKMSNGDQLISLTNFRDEGLLLKVKNVPLDSQDFIKNIKKIKLGGLADLEFKAKDIFRFEGLEAILRVNDVTVNGDNYGVLRLDADAPSIRETVNAFLTLDGDSTNFVVDGYYNPPVFSGRPNRKWRKDTPNYLDLNVSFEKVPTRAINYFVAEVSEVEGSVSAENVHLFGSPEKLELDGVATASDIQFRVNPIQVTYWVPEGQVRLTSDSIDATGAIVLDRFGHEAELAGGLLHDHLRDWRLGLKITTLDQKEGFLGLETSEEDNPLFYGTALGIGTAFFSGTFPQSRLDVFGRSAPGTHTFLSLTDSETTEQTRFVNYIEDDLKNGDGDSDTLAELRGLNMHFDFDINDHALMEVIFDKTWGDILSGRTEGNLKVDLTREGTLTMNGNLEVVSGKYLFTLMNLGLNKPFTVEPGGTVSWSGDPYEAILNVKAVYQGANASIANFIGEYLTAASQGTQDLARGSTPVHLKMHLTGRMLKPDIAFDFDFPQLDGELRGFAENKLRTIRQDQNELNRQVFGLLVLGQFMPTGYTLQAGDVGINTLSEMLSNQLSIYLTELVSELLVGTNFIEGIDFNVSYNRFSATLSDANIYTGDEVNVRTQVRFTNRLSLSGGVEVGVGGGSVTTNNGQTTGDIQIEYAITPDRRLKVKGYVRSEPDIGGGIRQKRGAGLSFRKEFDSLDELMNWGEFRRKRK